MNEIGLNINKIKLNGKDETDNKQELKESKMWLNIQKQPFIL